MWPLRYRKPLDYPLHILFQFQFGFRLLNNEIKLRTIFNDSFLFPFFISFIKISKSTKTIFRFSFNHEL